MIYLIVFLIGLMIGAGIYLSNREDRIRRRETKERLASQYANKEKRDLRKRMNDIVENDRNLR